MSAHGRRPQRTAPRLRCQRRPVGRKWAERGENLVFALAGDRLLELASAWPKGAIRRVLTARRKPVLHGAFNVALLLRDQLASIQLTANFDP
jgi:hypothetical protein